MLARLYIVLVALLYLGLSIWCSVQPEVTSEKVGFELVDGSGMSEFITVYGGLEFGMAVVFLASLIDAHTTRLGVAACVLIHLCLVIFRSYGFLTISDIDPFTYQLAAGEWVIMLLGAGILKWGGKRAGNAAA